MSTISYPDYQDQGRSYHVSEGTYIGGQEAQPIGAKSIRITADIDINKGDCVGIVGDFKVSTNSTNFIGIAFNTAKAGEEIVVQTRGFVKLIASGAIDAGTIVCKVSGDGKVATASAVDALYVGHAVSNAQDGEEVYVLIR